MVQEIFGVNPHIRTVAEGFAREGYIALAPAYFDPVETGVELDYDADGIAPGETLSAIRARAQQLQRELAAAL